jgi:hypothetical protein
MVGPSPTQLLGAARLTLGKKGGGWGSAWPRAVAFLARQALESGVELLWVGDLRGLRACSFRDQLACLPTYLGETDPAQRARQTWGSLSEACHAHPYELAPTAVELEGWMDDVELVLNSINQRAAMYP